MWKLTKLLLLVWPHIMFRSVDLHQILPHVWWWPQFIKLGQKFGGTLPHPKKNLEAQKHQNMDTNSDKFVTWIASISRMKRDIVERKMALQTTTYVYLIWRTLVNKWQKIEPEFWLTHTLTLHGSRFVLHCQCS